MERTIADFVTTAAGGDGEHYLLFDDELRGWKVPVQLAVSRDLGIVAVMASTSRGLPDGDMSGVIYHISRRSLVTDPIIPMIRCPRLELGAREILSVENVLANPDLVPQSLDLVEQFLMATAIRADLLLRGGRPLLVMDYEVEELLDMDGVLRAPTFRPFDRASSRKKGA